MYPNVTTTVIPALRPSSVRKSSKIGCFSWVDIDLLGQMARNGCQVSQEEHQEVDTSYYSYPVVNYISHMYYLGFVVMLTKRSLNVIWKSCKQPLYSLSLFYF